MKKRILSVLLALAMVFTLVPVTVFAAPTYQVVTVDKDTVQAGETVNVKVTLPNISETAGSFTVNLKFDTALFEVVSRALPPQLSAYNEGFSAAASVDIVANPPADANTSGELTANASYTYNTIKVAGVTVIDATLKAKASGVAAFSFSIFEITYSDNGTQYIVKKDQLETPPSVTISKAPISSVSFTLADPTQGAALPSLSDLGSGYTGAVEWYEGTGVTGSTAVTGNAKPNTKYTAKVTLTAKTADSERFAEGVTLPEGYTKVSADATTIVLTKTFDATGSLPAASVTAAPAAKSGLKYDGTEQGLLGFVGTANGGTMQYSLNGTTWSDTDPKGKNAGDYTVYYKVKGNSSHSDSAVANIQVTIGQKDISGVTIGAIANQVYDGGNELKPLPVVKDGTTPLVNGTDYTVSYTNNTNAGTATLTIKGKGNYNGTNSKNFTIDPATQTISGLSSINVAFGTTLDLNTVYSSNAPGATLTFARPSTSSLPGGTTFNEATGIVTAGNSTGSFSVTVDSAAVTNYKAALQKTITVYIKEKTPSTYATEPKAKTGLEYDGSEQELVTAGTANGGTVKYSLDGTTWTDAVPKGKNANTYNVQYKIVGDATHGDSTPKTHTVTIAPKVLQSSDLEKFGGSATKVYDGTATSSITVRVRASSLYGTDTLPINGSAVYNSANVSDANKITFTPTAITTGNYRLAATEVLTINNAKITAKDVKLTGGINATDRSYVKDNKTVNLTKGALTFTGLVSGETLDVNIPATGTISDAKVGAYNVTYSGVTLKDGATGKAGNYKLVSPLPTVTVNITKATARTLDDITYNLLYTTTSTQVANVGRAGMPEDAGTLTYAKGAAPMLIAGETVQVLDWSVDPVTGTVSYQLTNGSINNRVRFPVVISSTNYENSTVFVEIKLINKDNVSGKITFPDGSLVYNGDSQNQKHEKATISIAANGTAKWTYDYLPITATASLNTDNLPLTVGKYTVVATYEDDTQFGTKSATLEITPAKPTGTPTFTKITEKGKTLANANLGMGTLTPTGGTLEWVAGDTTVVEANKAYEWKYTPANPNYAPVTGTIVVYPVSTGIVIYSPCYTIKASAGANGSISPAGWCSVVENGNQTFTFTPDKGYTVAKVLVDGKSVGAVKSYTFKNVTKDHTIEVIFMKSNGNPATGVFVMP